MANRPAAPAPVGPQQGGAPQSPPRPQPPQTAECPGAPSRPRRPPGGSSARRSLQF